MNEKVTLLDITEAAEKRVSLIAQEFRDGFEFLKNYPRSVTFFGSARTAESDHFYQKARDLAGRVVTDLRYSVVTGGGPGIMQAANKGAFEAGGNSLGLTIDLPREQLANQYLTDRINFHHFFSRKVCLSFSAEAYIFFPGGFGTLDEFSEILTLVQTGKIQPAPIILFGEKHWQPLEEYFKNILATEGMIDNNDTSFYTITEDTDLIIELIKKAPVRFGLKYQDSKKAEDNTSHGQPDRPLSALSRLIRW